MGEKGQYAAWFEYTGRSALMVMGGETGLRYRFEGPGARVAVDPRDKPFLATIRNLKQV